MYFDDILITESTTISNEWTAKTWALKKKKHCNRKRKSCLKIIFFPVYAQYFSYESLTKMNNILRL